MSCQIEFKYIDHEMPDKIEIYPRCQMPDARWNIKGDHDDYCDDYHEA